MVLIVLDINGVLGDVRKRTAISVNHRVPEVILPNGQPFYARFTPSIHLNNSRLDMISGSSCEYVIEWEKWLCGLRGRNKTPLL